MQIMKRLARDLPVLYVNAMGLRFPSPRRDSIFFHRIARKLKSVGRGFIRVNRNYCVLTPFSVPVYGRKIIRQLNAMSVATQVRVAARRLPSRHPLIWIVSPPAVDVIRRMHHAAVVYQRTDDFREFEGVDREVIGQMDDELVQRADLVLHVNRTLHEQCTTRNVNSMLVSHGVDYQLFAEPSSSAEPPDIAAIPHPRIGFYGGIDSHTFDPDLLAQVALEISAAHFVLIGSKSIQHAALEAQPNVHFLGQKSYEQIPAYGRSFDVAIMPWRQNQWIARCNPVKLKEYLALGKPVVSTPYPEGDAFKDVVYFARGPAEFAECVRLALREETPTLEAARRLRVASDTWDALAARILARVNDLTSLRVHT
jgi:glycosyltransferase involved in cell wall biosynthesis